ncbi:hypothetical protein LEP1GSC051_0408 [Leptospira sp. P2653]|nr:hypothetical protein LEP1GSC051_0408 [Leptospira sp. P2653]
MALDEFGTRCKTKRVSHGTELIQFIPNIIPILMFPVSDH